MQPIEVQLKLGKETKGTYRYETDDDGAVITTLYVRKSAFEGDKAPKSIRLIVETGNS